MWDVGFKGRRAFWWDCVYWKMKKMVVTEQGSMKGKGKGRDYLTGGCGGKSEGRACLYLGQEGSRRSRDEKREVKGSYITKPRSLSLTSSLSLTFTLHLSQSREILHFLQHSNWPCLPSNRMFLPRKYIGTYINTYIHAYIHTEDIQTDISSCIWHLS